MTAAYVALGSNLQDPPAQLRAAVSALAALPATRLERVSSAWRSRAVGPGEQPDYLNAVARLATALDPEPLLDALQAIEIAQGRVRTQRWGPRTLDLDLLLYGDRVIATARLTVPHPRMQERNFVLQPLREVCSANFLLPGGEELDTLLQNCPGDRLHQTGWQPGAQ